ncbi:MAG TPA: SMP-30/gluconolactonase/LRE family protein [Coriobacteriia bacterium]|nr:SMP-30/gluconolactonase/LRE family protein [Coriobacteriia bacterium]
MTDEQREGTPVEPTPVEETAPESKPEVASGGSAGVAAESSATTPDGEEKRGLYMTPRGILTTVAIVLMLILIALLIYLLLMDRSGPGTRVEGDAIAGIKTEVVIRGPGTGKLPRFDGPMGAAWSPDGNQVYVADSTNNRICVFRKDGRFITEFGTFGIAKPLEGAKQTWDPGELNYPTDVAVDTQGRVYVADFYNDSISVFTANGEFLRRFPDPYKPTGKGSSGNDGKGIAVTALDVAEGKVYATDSYQIVVFDLNGKLLQQFGRPGASLGDLDRPNGVVADADARVVVSDSNNNRVVAFSPLGRPVWMAGKRLPSVPQTPEDTDFVLPRGATIMDDGDVLIADPLAQRLVRLSSEGEVVSRYGERGVLPSQLNFPNDVDWYGGRILIADRENDRIQIARLVGK